MNALKNALLSLGFTNVYDYSDEVDFALLWDSVGDYHDDCVIVWSSTWHDSAMGVVNSESLLSPIEWAAVRQHACEKVGATANTIIISPDPTIQTALPGMKMLGALNSEMFPWLRVWDGDALIDRVRESRGDILRIVAPIPCEHAIGFSPIWEQHLRSGVTSEPSTNHSLSNVVGAALLNPASCASPHVAALQKIFQVLDLLPKHPAGDEIRKADGIQSTTKAVLLDDMADRWKPFVAETLGLAPDALICPPVGRGQKSDLGALNHLITSLEQFVESPSRQCFLSIADIVPQICANKENCVLLLDLRLFGGEGDKLSTDETVYIDRLLELAGTIFSKKWNSAYPLISPDECDMALEGATGSQIESAGHRKAHTILARLISLIDPTLPIIIFSSSNQHLILKEFSGYKNIIVRFQKPSFRQATGDWQTVSVTTRESLRDAWRQAEYMLRVRSILRHLDERPIQPPILNMPQCSRIEVFLDESGKIS